MRKILFAVLIILISATIATAEPFTSNKKFEHRFYPGFTVEQVKEAVRKTIAENPFITKDLFGVKKYQWSETSESVLTSEPIMIFSVYFDTYFWTAKFTQKPDGVDAVWICTKHYQARASRTVKAGYVYYTHSEPAKDEYLTASIYNKKLNYILDRIEVTLGIKGIDDLPKEAKQPEKPTEEISEEQ